MKKKITKNEYLTAQGLFYLAQLHHRKSDDYERALASLLEDELYMGHISDELGNGGTLDEALKKEHIEVEK